MMEHLSQVERALINRLAADAAAEAAAVARAADLAIADV